MTVILDDHLLRDWIALSDPALEEAINDEDIGTTNLWYARLCKSVARASTGAVLRGWDEKEREALVAGLVALPPTVTIVPMRRLAWRMGKLVAEHRGLSTLGAEAAAAARNLPARILVSERDDGPGLRRCCATIGVNYRAIPRGQALHQSPS